jgi:hypothetical protein
MGRPRRLRPLRVRKTRIIPWSKNSQSSTDPMTLR